MNSDFYVIYYFKLKNNFRLKEIFLFADDVYTHLPNLLKHLTK